MKTKKSTETALLGRTNLPEIGDAVARTARGRTREGAVFPTAPSRLGLPSDYADTLADLKHRIRQERLRVVLAANSAMVLLYWDIGRMILGRQETAGWGAKVIDRLSADLREAFPDMKGLSPRNLKYMRAFAAAWPGAGIVQEALAQIPWYHNVTLIERLHDTQTRLWYARRAAEQAWSQSILCLHIEGQDHRRQAKALSNFEATLPPADSDLAQQVFKDPYLFDFLGTAEPRREAEVEQALVDHIQHFLLELGSGFAFVGRQVLLEVGGHDYFVDLLFYHLQLRRYVVIELKATPFEPAFVGQLNLYLSAVDDLMRHPDDKPSIGLLLCRSKDGILAEYALRDLRKPIGVAEWKTRLVAELPKDLKGSLPSVEELEAELAPRKPERPLGGKAKGSHRDDAQEEAHRGALPLEASNKASAREKSIRHEHPSTLHLGRARRPLAAARAVLFAQRVDDTDCSQPPRRRKRSDSGFSSSLSNSFGGRMRTDEKILDQAREGI